MRRKFRIPDWIFISLLLLGGLYPIIILGRIDLYHIIKIGLLGAVLWLSRFGQILNFAWGTAIAILLIGYSGYLSIIDKPVFPVEVGAFAKEHPEMSALSEVERGRYIFTTICNQCHGDDGKKGLFQAADLTQTTLSLEQKIETISKGSPLTVMRSFSLELTQEEIENVADYIHQMAN